MTRSAKLIDDVGLHQFQQHIAGGIPLAGTSGGDGIVEEGGVCHELHELHEFDFVMIIPFVMTFFLLEWGEDSSRIEETRMFF